LEVKVMQKNKALCLVPEDQLSLAIGKEGQNVRLAAKLTGWKIDIRSLEKEEPAESPSGPENQQADDGAGIQAGKKEGKEVSEKKEKPEKEEDVKKKTREEKLKKEKKETKKIKKSEKTKSAESPSGPENQQADDGAGVQAGKKEKKKTKKEKTKVTNNK